MKKREIKTKEVPLFRLSLFAQADFWKKGSQGETRPRHRCHHALTFISSDRYLFCQEACFQGHQIDVAPLALDQRQALKDDKPGIPMTSPKVALAFHSGHRRPQNCFSVCTRSKTQNTTFSVIVTNEIHQDRQQQFKLLRYATSKTNTVSPTPPSPPPPPSHPTTSAVHTLRPPRNVGHGCAYSPIIAFGEITTFTTR